MLHTAQSGTLATLTSMLAMDDVAAVEDDCACDKVVNRLAAEMVQEMNFIMVLFLFAPQHDISPYDKQGLKHQKVHRTRVN